MSAEPKLTADVRNGTSVTPSADTVRVTLWFDTSIADVERYLADDYRPEAGEGITVESLAAALIRNHQARFGYIGWRIGHSDGGGCA